MFHENANKMIFELEILQTYILYERAICGDTFCGLFLKDDLFSANTHPYPARQCDTVIWLLVHTSIASKNNGREDESSYCKVYNINSILTIHCF